MHLIKSSFFSASTLALAACGFLNFFSDVRAQPLELTVTPFGSAASGRPLPVGAMPTVKISLRNSDNKPIGPVEVAVHLGELAAGRQDGWRQEDRTLRTVVGEIPAGAQIEREVRLRVDTAPTALAKAKILFEAKHSGGRTVESEAELSIADCAGAYRSRLQALRPGLAQPVRDAGDQIRKSDPSLPASRQFPPTGARNGDLARAERLAAIFAARRGADPQMDTEWFRFLLQRFASELNAYAGQPANPGICANNYYQIAGYRQGLLPLTRHIDATRAATAVALDAARREAPLQSGDVDEIVQTLLKSAEIDGNAAYAGALASLAVARGMLRERRANAETLRKFSIAETAAWLAETDRRGQNLVQAIEQALATIATAHKENCVCAF